MKWLVIALAVSMAGCVGPGAEPAPDIAPVDPAPQMPAPTPTPRQTAADHAHPGATFLVIGDQGMGTDGQYEIADGLNHECEDHPCTAIVGAGGNLGHPAMSVDDEAFFQYFEDPYRDLDVPFWLALGGSDDGEGTLDAAAETQVAYSRWSGAPSDKWTLPARWHVQEAGGVQWLFLDSGSWDHPERGAAQQAWLQDTLATPWDGWRLAVVHDPYITDGPWQATPPYRAWIEASLCGQVDILVSGRSDALEWFDPQPDCSETYHMTSGAAAAWGPLLGVHEGTYQEATLGYWLVESGAACLRVEALDEDHGRRFTAALPRHSSHTCESS